MGMEMTKEFGRTMALRVGLLAVLTGAAAPAVAESYCFRAGPDGASDLRLDIAGNGRASFTLESWQGGGHSCGASGQARAIEGGWVYRETIDGARCEIVLARTEDGGILLQDTDNRCRTTLCGARAMIDGLAFPHTSRVAC
jgi:hypothetical protein